MTKDFFDNCDDLDLDEGMLPYLKQINSISGIVTEYSCSGHYNCDRDSEHFNIETERGYIMCSVTESMFDLLAKKIYPNMKESVCYLKTNLFGTDMVIHTHVGFEIDYGMDYTRMKLNWYVDNFDEFMNIFIEKLKCYSESVAD